MKPPRVTDFDPNAEPEAETPRLGSPMDGLAKIEKPSTLAAASQRIQAELTSDAHQDDLKQSRFFQPPTVPEQPRAVAPTTRTEGKNLPRTVAKSDDDPAVNKVGFYFTHHEIDALDQLVTRLTPRLRDEFGIRATKNEVIRACLAAGLKDIDEHDFDSAVLKLITSK